MKKMLLSAFSAWMLILTPYSLVHSQINPNGGFETGSPGVHTGTDVAGWTMLAEGGSSAVFEIVNDVGIPRSGNQALKVSVDIIGTNSWEPQVFNTDFPVTSNTTYEVSAWVASEVEGVQVIVTAGSLSPNYHEWGRKSSGQLALLSWTNVTFQFTTRNPEPEPRGGVPIHFGAADNSQFLPYVVYLDDIEVKNLTTGITDRISSLPNAYSLSQNYPNPFNPSTEITFDLPSKSFVSLKVFDCLGKEVATLLSQDLPAGSHSQQWIPANLPSGVYFYRLSAVPSARPASPNAKRGERDLVSTGGLDGQAGSFTETKKLVLLK